MNTKDQILDQTFTLIMKYGIKSVSMDDISRKLGISKKTIYQYFENKRALIGEVIENHIQKDECDVSAIISNSKNAIEEIVMIARHMLTFLRGMSPSMMFDTQKYYPKQWAKVEQEHFNFIRNVILKNIERGQNEGYYNTDTNAEIISRLYIQQSLALTNEELFPLNDYDRGELYKTLVTYHIRGIMTAKGHNIAKKLTID